MRISEYQNNYTNYSNYNVNNDINTDGIVRIKSNNADADISIQKQDNINIDVNKDNKEQDSQSSDTGIKQFNLNHTQAAKLAENKELKTDKELIGRDSNIDNLDVRKAVSDMKKDSILREYQTFVANPFSQDGSVRKIIR